MMPIRRRRSIADDIDPDAMHVFVPGIMGAGVLVSIGLLIGDLLRKVGGGRGTARQGALAAGHVVREFAESVHHDDVVGRRLVGLRSRRTYGLAAAAFLGIGIYGLVGSFWNYVNPVDDGWVEDIAWLWVLSVAIGVGLTWVGGILATLFFRWPLIPSSAFALLAKTPLGKTPPDREQP